LNGKLTLGENFADNGGLRIAYMALMDTLAKKAVPKIEGYTAEQRLFLAGDRSGASTERGGNAYAHAHRSTFARLVPRERDRVEYAGVPEGVLVYGGAAHGAGERLPGFGSAIEYSNVKTLHQVWETYFVSASCQSSLKRPLLLPCCRICG